MYKYNNEVNSIDWKLSEEFIKYICDLYGDHYDDRIENSRPPVAGNKARKAGDDWAPGQIANHKSLASFQKQLADIDIKLSTSKIRKILINGGCWSTERSRQIKELFDTYTIDTSEGGDGLSGETAVRKIAEKLGVSLATVSMNLPYQDVVYKLENRSSNARRCVRYRERRRKT